ncbi:endonuclease [bacterium AH-315-C07]|nr:endonuclease [bacterium AH-315-C07]
MSAQPAGYYDGTYGIYQEDLREKLYNIIKDHDQQQYDNVWSHFEGTDKQNDGSVWDMYSDNPSGSSSYTYQFGTDKCGNYDSEGDCYNREHSFPKSWFDDALPMYSDLFALYPTDGYVNNKRGNYPYGEVSNSNWTSTNGSKVGSSSYPGYSGTVFEPIDEYKGDLARTYFYMITRYKPLVSNWNSDMLGGDEFTLWAADMLYSWHIQDPVSDKEIDRNDAIYLIQDNRNPYIDRPYFVDYIWGPTASVVEKPGARISIRYTNDILKVSGYQGGKPKLDIYNLMGQKIGSADLQKENCVLNLSLRNGVYVAVMEDEASTTIKKFMVSD